MREKEREREACGGERNAEEKGGEEGSARKGVCYVVQYESKVQLKIIQCSVTISR